MMLRVRAATWCASRRALARAASTPAAPTRLGWSDEEVAAHIQAVVVPALVTEKLSQAEAAERLGAELAALRDLDCFVWTRSWAAALDYFAAQAKRHRARRKRLGSMAAEATEEAAQQLFDMCVTSGVEPNSYVYSRLVQAQGSYKHCRIAFDFMVLDGTTPDEECVLSVLDICSRYRTTARHKAESLMSFLEHEGLVPSRKVWDRVLRIYSRSGDLPGASDLLLRMRDAGVPLGADTYTHFLEVCSRSPSADNFDTAELAVAQCLESGLELPPAALAKLMAVYERQGALKRGKYLYKSAQGRNAVSSELTWAYARLLAKAGDGAARAEARRLQREVRARYAATLKHAAPERYAKFVKLRAQALAKAKAKPRVPREKKATKQRPADLISQAIERHLAQTKKNNAASAPGASPQAEPANDAAAASGLGGVRAVDKTKVVRLV